MNSSVEEPCEGCLKTMGVCDNPTHCYRGPGGLSRKAQCQSLGRRRKLPAHTEYTYCPPCPPPSPPPATSTTQSAEVSDTGCPSNCDGCYSTNFGDNNNNCNTGITKGQCLAKSYRWCKHAYNGI